MTDIALNNDKGYYDISWTESGDLSTHDSLDTAILMSIFDEARADKNEIAQPHLRRGWLGNETSDGFEQGSIQWEFEQERITGTTLKDLGNAIQRCLEWMVNYNIATRVNVSRPFLKNGIVKVNIDLYRDNDKIMSKTYDLWENTGNF